LKLIPGHGLKRIDGWPQGAVPLVFDEEFVIIEAPTRWLMHIAKLRSRSTETLRKYAWIIGRYFQWLDDAGYGAQNWIAVDIEVFEQYLAYIMRSKKASDFGPLEATAYDYAARIVAFYDWARRVGYRHFLEVDREEVTIRLTDQTLLAHVQNGIVRDKLDFNLPSGRAAFLQKEVQKFVTQAEFEVAVSLLDDEVFKVIATIIRITAMRPKELLQIPYRGDGENAGFIPYDIDEIPENLSLQNIMFSCRSKGKNRRIQFPGRLWKVICQLYIPLRRERAEIYRARKGVSPRNSVLFLTRDGYPVDYSILFEHFSKVVKASDSNRVSGAGPVYDKRVFNARMLRHTCATYFVYEALKKNNMLGRSFVYDAAVDEDLRDLLGHNDVGTSYKYYVHLANRFFKEDLLADLHRSRVDAGLSALLTEQGYGGGGAPANPIG